jgi:hypothetical protein
MKSEREYFEVVTFDGKIYAIGGSMNSIYGRINERYDPKTDKWTTLAAMPTPRTGFATVIYEGKIYCIGGAVPYIGPGAAVSSFTDVVEVYDPVNDLWSKKTALPTASSPVACVINNQLFVITHGGQMYAYNPSDDSWSSKASLPVSINYVTTRIINDQIFAIIKNDANELLEMFMYNSVIDSWTKKATPFSHNLPPFTGTTFTVVNDKIIVYCHQTYVDSAKLNIKIYDPKTDKWSEGTAGPESNFYGSIFVDATSGVYAPKKIYVFGYEQIDYDTFQAFTWVYDPVNNVWSTAKAMQTYRIIAYQRTDKLIVIDDTFYIIGSNNFNAQYIPIGYSSNDIPSKPALSLNATIVIVAIILTISLTAIGLLFYIKKRGKQV